MSFVKTSGMVAASAVVGAGLLRLACADKEPTKSDAVHGTAQCRLDAARGAFLLGEPVVLRLAITNTGNKKAREFVVDNGQWYPASLIEVSRDGNRFTHLGEMATTQSPFRPTSLFVDPGESKTYEIKVFYDLGGRRSMAFPDEGVYWIRVRFPLDGEALKPKNVAVSNAVSVKIVKPSRSDAKIWDSVGQYSEYARFVYYGARLEKSHEVVRVLLNLQDTYPESGYSESFRQALRRYYLWRSRRFLTESEEKRLRHITQIGSALDFNDHRLMGPVTQKPPDEDLALEEALRWLEKVAKVSFECQDVMRARRVGVFVRDGDTVGRLMDMLAEQVRAVWLKGEKGYMLTRE